MPSLRAEVVHLSADLQLPLGVATCEHDLTRGSTPR
jgi:hypothetical protein